MRSAGYYSVDAKAETAIDGEWRKGPGKELFDALEKVHLLCPHSWHCAHGSPSRCQQRHCCWPCVPWMHSHGMEHTMAPGTWARPVEAPARHGPPPGAALTTAAGMQELGHVPIVAEDLGVITDDVNALRVGIGAPGMVVLQFAWGSGGTNIHLPHNHYENSVCYPGEPALLLPCALCPDWQAVGGLPGSSGAPALESIIGQQRADAAGGRCTSCAHV